MGQRSCSAGTRAPLRARRPRSAHKRDRLRIAQARRAADRRARHHRLVARQAQGGAAAHAARARRAAGRRRDRGGARRAPRAVRRATPTTASLREQREEALRVDAPARAVRPRCWSAASRRAGPPSTATSASSSSPTIRRPWRSRSLNAGSRVPARCGSDRDGADASCSHRTRAARSGLRSARRRSAATPRAIGTAEEPRLDATRWRR